MTAANRMADDVRPPVAVTDGTTGAAGVFAYDLAGGVASFIIPSAWRGKYVSFHCDGGTGLYILCGGDAVAATIATMSTVASNAITFKNTTCWCIEAGLTEPYLMPPASETAITRFSLIGKSAAGVCRAYLSTGSQT